MKRVFNSINARFEINELIYFHSGEIKSFPSQSFDKPFGRAIRRVSESEVEVEIFLK